MHYQRQEDNKQASKQTYLIRAAIKRQTETETETESTNPNLTTTPYDSRKPRNLATN